MGVITRRPSRLAVVRGGLVTIVLVAVAYTLWPRASEDAIIPPEWVESAPTWSPDGTKIAFVRASEDACGGDVYVVGSRGGKPRRVTSVADPETGRGALEPAWSPDGRRIAFSVSGFLIGTACSEEELATVAADGTGLRTIASGIGTDTESCHSWSPDGRWIAFAEAGAPHETLVVAETAGRRLRRLARATLWGGCPVWSPNGRSIAFVRGANSDALSGEVYVVTLGGGEHRLTRTRGSASSPTWAPDGTKLAFVTAAEQGAQSSNSIRTVRADGGDEARIAQAPDTDTLDQLDWSPDGRRLAFTSSDRGSEELVVIGADGGGRSEALDACCHAWSPGGTTLAFVSSNRIHVARADRLGVGQSRPLSEFS